VHGAAGAAGGRTVVWCHGAPGSGAFDPDPEATRARGVTLVGVDRPGYGRSTPVEPGTWATVAGAADDIAAVVRRMDTGPVGVAGWSAGGRVALAFAARHPDLVDRVVVIATPAPDEAIPWMPPETRAALGALRGRSVRHVHDVLAAQLAPLARASVADVLGAAPVDQPTLARRGVRPRLDAMLDEAFRQGTVGLAADLAGYCLQPWGFEVGEVRAKTLLLYGARDTIAGPRHARWYHETLPDARIETAPGAGHLVLIPMWERAMSFLAPQLSPAAGKHRKIP
jgi:pimeloyl-ACP methyl ester carboxylesterase